MTTQNKLQLQELGKRLKMLLEEKGMSQAQLYRAAGLDAQMVSRIVRGRRAPEFTTIQKIINGLPDDIDLRWFLVGDGSDRSTWITVEELERLATPPASFTPQQIGRRQRARAAETQE